MLYKLFSAFALQHYGVECRVCGDAVKRGDQLGMSESVCSKCR